jgi:hypothetical protein
MTYQVTGKSGIRHRIEAPMPDNDTALKMWKGEGVPVPVCGTQLSVVVNFYVPTDAVPATACRGCFPDGYQYQAPATYTPAQVEAVFLQAFAAAEVFIGEDEALDIMLAHGIGNQLGAAEAVTRDEAVAAFNDLAEYVKTEYNPDGTEDSDSIRSDSAGDLVVNLAIGFLDDPEAEAYDVIAASWKDLADGPTDEGPERDAAIVAEVTSWF